MFQYTETYAEVQDKVRQFERNNDFPKRDEYLKLLDLMEREDTTEESEIERLEDENMHLADEITELQNESDVQSRSLASIESIAKKALAHAEQRDDISDDESPYLDALADILSHAQ